MDFLPTQADFKIFCLRWAIRRRNFYYINIIIEYYYFYYIIKIIITLKVHLNNDGWAV